MHCISAGVATCLVMAVAVGCGEVPAHSASALHTAAPATTGSPDKNSGAVTTDAPAGTGAPPGCQGPAGPTVKTLTITLADNEKTYCVRVGDKLRVYLSGTDSSPWSRPLVSGNALTPIPDGAPARSKGITDASFVAVRPGRVIVISIRPPCQFAIASDKSHAEPAFPVPRTYPLRFCPSGQRYSASINVLR
jgi:hypothetical protein